MGAQTVAETPVGRNDNVVICLKSDEYSVTNEPLGKSVIEDVNNQIASLEVFAYLFHSIEVIGLQRKDARKKTNGKIQKVGKLVQFLLK